MPAADGTLPLDADSTLPFFFLDAHEDIVRDKCSQGLYP